MSKSSEFEDAMRFAVLLAKYAPKKAPKGCQYGAGAPWLDVWTVRDALEIRKIALRRQSLAIRQCNEPMDEGKVERTVAKICARLEELLKPYRATAEVHGDPRGQVVRVMFPGGEKNGWGDGWGVG